MDYRVDDRKTATSPQVLRASSCFWLASGVVSGVVPVMLMSLRTPDPSLEAVSTGLLLLLTALQCWAAVRLLQGERWARNVLTIVAVLSLAGFVALNGVLVVVGLFLSLTGAVLMWLPASSTHIRRSHPPLGQAGIPGHEEAGRDRRRDSTDLLLLGNRESGGMHADHGIIEVGPSHAWSVSRQYGIQLGRTRLQRASLALGVFPSVAIYSVAGFLIRNGPITAGVGTERQARGLKIIVYLMSLAVGASLGPLWFQDPAVASLIFAILALLGIAHSLFLLPAMEAQRARGLRVSGRKWKKRHGVRRVWAISGIVHDESATVHELASAFQSIFPDLPPGWAIIACTCTETQSLAFESLGFRREHPRSGLLHRIAQQMVC